MDVKSNTVSTPHRFNLPVMEADTLTAVDPNLSSHLTSPHRPGASFLPCFRLTDRPRDQLSSGELTSSSSGGELRLAELPPPLSQLDISTALPSSGGLSGYYQGVDCSHTICCAHCAHCAQSKQSAAGTPAVQNKRRWKYLQTGQSIEAKYPPPPSHYAASSFPPTPTFTPSPRTSKLPPAQKQGA